MSSLLRDRENVDPLGPPGLGSGLGSSSTWWVRLSSEQIASDRGGSHECYTLCIRSQGSGPNKG